MTAITVVIPAYNVAPFIGAALDSVLSQSPAPGAVIVVNDGSTDETPETLAGYGKRIRVIRQDNGGTAAARNAAIAAAATPYVALLDGDDVWLPGMLKALGEAAQRWPQAALIHTRCDSMTAAGERLPRTDPPPPGDWLEEDALERLLIHCYPNMSTVLLRRDAWEEAGPFNPEYRAEDWEFCLRLAERFPFAYVGDTYALYRIHGASKTGNLIGHTRGLLQMRTYIEEQIPRWKETRDSPTLRAMIDRHHREYAHAWSRLGRLLRAQGETAAARDAYREAVRWEPGAVKYRARYFGTALAAALSADKGEAR